MKNLKYIAAVGIVALGLASCVKDLNTTPIDKNSTTGFNQDALFTKIYATLASTGQTGPAGSGDLDGIDEGVSAFYRVMWELNEFPTDEGWWIWGDPGVKEVRDMSWDGENTLVKGLYYRFIIDIKYCNHFINYADQSTAEGKKQVAEVRVIRALNYWYLLDMFKFAPYIEKETTDPRDYPQFLSRPELFDWLEKELQDLAASSDLVNKQDKSSVNKYRVDKAAVYLLQCRLYLNAEVYLGKGNTRWDEAIVAANNALSCGYKLMKDKDKKTQFNAEGDSITFTSYQQLFMGDNDKNGAQEEAVLLVYQDGKYCQTYGGVQFCIAATRDGGMTPWGCSANWKCFRTSPEMVYKFIDQSQTGTVKANEYTMKDIAGDDRAILCNYVEGDPNTWKLAGGATAEFYDSWACPKFTAVYSDVDSLQQVKGSDSEWPDTDIPLMRIAEAHMTKAEALYRQGDASGALDIINNSIRSRAHAAALTKLDDMTLCDEWCREFWGEGRRRTDLIRFGYFAGEKAAEYKWEGKGKAAEEKWNWYPIPSDDKKTNENFKLQVLGNADNEYKDQGGDGYTYVTGD